MIDERDNASLLMRSIVKMCSQYELACQSLQSSSEILIPLRTCVLIL